MNYNYIISLYFDIFVILPYILAKSRRYLRANRWCFKNFHINSADCWLICKI